MSTAPLYINSIRVEGARFPMAHNDGDFVVAYVNGRRKVFAGLNGKLCAPSSFARVLVKLQSTRAGGAK